MFHPFRLTILLTILLYPCYLFISLRWLVTGESSCEQISCWTISSFSAVVTVIGRKTIRFSVIVPLSLNIFSNFCTYPLYHYFMGTLYKYDTRSNLFPCNHSSWKPCHHSKSPFWCAYTYEKKLKWRANVQMYVDENWSNNADLKWSLSSTLLLSCSANIVCAIAKHKVVSFFLFFNKNLLTSILVQLENI